MGGSTISRDMSEREPKLHSTEERASTAAGNVPGIEGHHQPQEDIQVPELRILEMLKTYHPGEKQHSEMEKSSSAAAEERQVSAAAAPSPSPSPQGDLRREEADNASMRSEHGTRDGRDTSETEEARMPARVGPAPKKSRKRAYQKLEEEAEDILKGWTPTGTAGVTTRGVPRAVQKEPSREKGRAKAVTKSEPKGKPGASSRTAKVEAQAAPRHKIRRTDYADVGPSAQDAAAGSGKAETTAKTRGARSRGRGRSAFGATHEATPKSARKASETKLSASEPSLRGRGRPRGRPVSPSVRGRGALGARRATNADAPKNKAESGKSPKEKELRLATWVQTGRVTKAASRGRGRPRKAV